METKYFLVRIDRGVEITIINPTEPVETRDELVKLARKEVQNDFNIDYDSLFYIRQTDTETSGGSFRDAELDSELGNQEAEMTARRIYADVLMAGDGDSGESEASAKRIALETPLDEIYDALDGCQRWQEELEKHPDWFPET